MPLQPRISATLGVPQPCVKCKKLKQLHKYRVNKRGVISRVCRICQDVKRREAAEVRDRVRTSQHSFLRWLEIMRNDD